MGNCEFQSSFIHTTIFFFVPGCSPDQATIVVAVCSSFRGNSSRIPSARIFYNTIFSCAPPCTTFNSNPVTESTKRLSSPTSIFLLDKRVQPTSTLFTNHTAEEWEVIVQPPPPPLQCYRRSIYYRASERRPAASTTELSSGRLVHLRIPMVVYWSRTDGRMGGWDVKNGAV